MKNARRIAGSSPVRVLAGLAISLLFIVVTFARVDLGGVARTIGRATPGWLLVALLLGLAEVGVRAWRWQTLLAPFVRVPYRLSAAYLCIGYFANALLPVRLGDVARSYLAGSAFGAPRLAVLGTVLVERLADGLAVVAIALVLGFEVAQGHALALTALWVGLVALIALGLMTAFVVVLPRLRLGSLQPIEVIKPFLTQLALGGQSLRSASGSARLVVSTLLPLGIATGTLAAVAAAMGISLSPVQAGLAMAAIALSTAIPAAPSSVGTYEFVGLTILTALGVAPEPALAAVVILHVIGTLPVALAGLVLTWHYHVRVATLVQPEVPITP